MSTAGRRMPVSDSAPAAGQATVSRPTQTSWNPPQTDCRPAGSMATRAALTARPALRGRATLRHHSSRRRPQRGRTQTTLTAGQCPHPPWPLPRAALAKPVLVVWWSRLPLSSQARPRTLDGCFCCCCSPFLTVRWFVYWTVTTVQAGVYTRMTLADAPPSPPFRTTAMAVWLTQIVGVDAQGEDLFRPTPLYPHLPNSRSTSTEQEYTVAKSYLQKQSRT